METSRAARDAVKRRLLEGFSATPYPGDEHLVAVQDGTDPECREIESAFKGKDWRDVSVEMVRDHKDALPLFTPAAFRYYLPAYMIGCVESPREVDVALDSVLFNLTPPKKHSGWQWDRFWARAQQFDEHEREAIRSFLELMEQDEIEDWASAGMKPPKSRVKSALAYWKGL
jgi:hypothetical protein